MKDCLAAVAAAHLLACSSLLEPAEVSPGARVALLRPLAAWGLRRLGSARLGPMRLAAGSDLSEQLR